MTTSKPADRREATLRRREVKSVIAMGTILAASLLLAFSIPVSWSGTEGPLAWLIQAVSSVVPSIQKMAAVSSFPGVMESFLTIVWVCIFVTTTLLVLRHYQLDRVARIPEKARWLVIGLPLLCSVNWFWLTWYSIRLAPNDGGDLANILRACGNSRFLLGTYGACVYGVCTIILTSVVVVGRNFRRLWLVPPSQSVSNNSLDRTLDR